MSVSLLSLSLSDWELPNSALFAATMAPAITLPVHNRLHKSSSLKQLWKNLVASFSITRTCIASTVAVGYGRSHTESTVKMRAPHLLAQRPAPPHQHIPTTALPQTQQIGRASCRERVCHYV